MDLPHMRRCFKAGLVVVQGRTTLVLTEAGKDALDNVCRTCGRQGVSDRCRRRLVPLMRVLIACECGHPKPDHNDRAEYGDGRGACCAEVLRDGERDECPCLAFKALR